MAGDGGDFGRGRLKKKKRPRKGGARAKMSKNDSYKLVLRELLGEKKGAEKRGQEGEKRWKGGPGEKIQTLRRRGERPAKKHYTKPQKV